MSDDADDSGPEGLFSEPTEQALQHLLLVLKIILTFFSILAFLVGILRKLLA
jgi:hypothetical protein